MPDDFEPPAEEIIRYDKDAKTRIATITSDRPGYFDAPTIAARLRYAELLHSAGALSRKTRKKARSGKDFEGKRKG
jgi:enoyl-CoA hydratase